MGMVAAIAAGLSAGSAIGGGMSANREAKYQAAQLDIAAGQEQASAQRRAEQERRKSRVIQSRALAVAGASGGGVSDVTVLDIVSDIASEGAYRAEVARYEGDDRAQKMHLKGDAARREGKAQQNAGYIKAAATILSSGTSLYDKYGGGGWGGTGMSENELVILN